MNTIKGYRPSDFGDNRIHKHTDRTNRINKLVSLPNALEHERFVALRKKQLQKAREEQQVIRYKPNVGVELGDVLSQYMDQILADPKLKTMTIHVPPLGF